MNAPAGGGREDGGQGVRLHGRTPAGSSAPRAAAGTPVRPAARTGRMAPPRARGGAMARAPSRRGGSATSGNGLRCAPGAAGLRGQRVTARTGRRSRHRGHRAGRPARPQQSTGPGAGALGGRRGTAAAGAPGRRTPLRGRTGRADGALQPRMGRAPSSRCHRPRPRRPARHGAASDCAESMGPSVAATHGACPVAPQPLSATTPTRTAWRHEWPYGGTGQAEHRSTRHAARGTPRGSARSAWGGHGAPTPRGCERSRMERARCRPVGRPGLRAGGCRPVRTAASQRVRRRAGGRSRASAERRREPPGRCLSSGRPLERSGRGSRGATSRGAGGIRAGAGGARSERYAEEGAARGGAHRESRTARGAPCGTRRAPSSGEEQPRPACAPRPGAAPAAAGPPAAPCVAAGPGAGTAPGPGGVSSRRRAG